MNTKRCKLGLFEWEDDRLIYFTVENPEPSIEDIREYHTLYREVLDSTNGPCLILFDSAVAKWMSSEKRIEFGKVGKTIEEHYGHRIRRIHIVITSPVILMILKGINLVLKPQIPQKVHKSRKEAIAAMQAEVSSL